MSGFVRRFDYMPTLDVLAEIEGVAIVDLMPPSIFLGRATGTVCLVGEWPAGPLATPTEADSAQRVTQGTFGGFSLSCSDPFSYDAGADAFTNPYSNGNAHAWLAGKKFRKLLLVRVDNTLAEGVHVRLTSSPAVAATGSIQIPAGGGASLVNRETFTLDDGYNPAVVFEFLSSGTVTPGRVAVAFTGGDNQATVAAAAKAAIDAERTAGRLALTTGAIAAGLFSLTNDYEGEHGNVAASDTVADAGFVVTGMSGGDGMGILLSDLTVPAGTRVYDASQTDREFALAQNVTFEKGTDLGTVGYTAFDPSDLAAKYATRTVSDVPVYSTKGVSENAVSDVDTVNATDLARAGIGAGTDRPDIVVTVSTGALDGASANTSALAALSSSAYDARYEAALLTTLPGASGGVADDVDMIACARESSAIRTALRDNARVASSQGIGRRALIRPPIGTTLAGAKTASSPGVAATRSKRVVYCFPHFVQRLPELAALDPNAEISSSEILVGADSAMATLLSQLAPELNPGQSTAEYADGGLLSFVLRLEPGLTGAADAATSFVIDDYIAMKANGIAGLRRDPDIAEWVFQSGVTSVDPTAYPAFAPINQVRMADFINDSMAAIAKRYSKKAKTASRFSSLVGDLVDFLEVLKSEDAPDLQRIDDFAVDTKSGNTASLKGTGVSIVQVKVSMLETLDVIVLQSQIGAGVEITSLDEAA